MAKKKSKTNKELQAEIVALRSQLHCHLHGAFHELKKTGPDRFMASAVIISITDQSGKQVVTPFMCADGLEAETIAALQSQIKKTVALHTIGKF